METVVTEANFDEIIASGQPVLVDFWAPWCGPCRALSPVVEELANEYDGKAVIGKCNVDENAELGTKFRVMSIPCLLFFKDGQLVDRLMGAQPKSAIKSKIDSIL